MLAISAAALRHSGHPKRRITCTTVRWSFHKSVASTCCTAAPAAGSVKVMTDTLARPGAMISGKVTFSDGQAADWYVDNEGRPGLVPATPGYRPSAEDIQQFQVLLDAEFRKLGY